MMLLPKIRWRMRMLMLSTICLTLIRRFAPARPSPYSLALPWLLWSQRRSVVLVALAWRFVPLLPAYGLTPHHPDGIASIFAAGWVGGDLPGGRDWAGLPSGASSSSEGQGSSSFGVVSGDGYAEECTDRLGRTHTWCVPQCSREGRSLGCGPQLGLRSVPTPLFFRLLIA